MYLSYKPYYLNMISMFILLMKSIKNGNKTYIPCKWMEAILIIRMIVQEVRFVTVLIEGMRIILNPNFILSCNLV